MTSRRREPPPGDEAERRTGIAPRVASAPRARGPGRGPILRDLAGIRRQVAELARMLAGDRPAVELLRRSSAIRAELRATRRRVVLLHVRHAIEEMLPEDWQARTRRELLELLASYPQGVPFPARTSEPSRARNRLGGSP
jgi:DNA-binding FrmR family transcriptional regulator